MDSGPCLYKQEKHIIQNNRGALFLLLSKGKNIIP